LSRVTEYDSYHSLACISLKNGGGYIDKVNYYFDALTGNLNRRNDIANNRDEYFGYDNLERLTDITRSGVTGEIAYTDNGNIQAKFDVGTYQYAGGAHAVSGIVDRAEGYEPRPLDVAYTSYNRPTSISSQEAILKQLWLEYGADNQRRISRYCEDSVLLKTKHYAGNYEKEILADSLTKEYDYVYTPDGLSVIVVTVGSNRTFFYVQTDHLGSIRVVTTADKSIQTRYYYDAWGQRSVTAGSSITDRGYLAQEHLDEFGLINLNARLYDPVLGRFLGMDPYVQEPDFSQSHNRYAYCLNNPLKYTDPNGEWFGIDDLIVAGAGFIVGYVSHGLSTGNWGWSAVASGGMGAVSAWLGFNTMGASSAMGAWQFAGYNAANTAVSSFMPSVNIPIGDHFELSVSTGFMFGPTGATGGLNFGLGYHNGDLAIGAGFGVTNAYTAWNVAATYKGWGAGYGETYYGASEIMGHKFDAQTTGSITAYFNGNSFRLENDTWGDGKDRWRTSAAELTIGKWSFGTHLYTNYGDKDSHGMQDGTENCVPPKFLGLFNGKNNNEGLSTWTNGRPYYAPFWVGYRHGNQVTRFGYSNSFVHNNTQNFVHKGFGKQNYYMSYDEFRAGGFYSTGTYNPFSLYNR
jgi:RHS repeat-associated protein